MNKVRIVVPFGTRNPEAAIAAASGAGRHALPRSWRRTRNDVLISFALLRLRYEARHAHRAHSARSRRCMQPATFRRLGYVSMLASVATLAVGVTSALMSATGQGKAGAFSTGSVTVGLDSGTPVQCTVADLTPGDASSAYLPASSSVANNSSQQCSYLVKYTGSVPAFLAVDVAVSNGSTKLYDASATGLQLLVRDNASTFVGSAANAGGIKFTGQAGGAFGQTLASPGSASNLLVSTSAKSSGFTDKFTVDYNLAIPSSNSNIGGSSTVTLTFHAVQASNNALPASCNAAAVSCVTGMSWS